MARNNKSKIILTPGEGDPWAMLALAVIERAARDFRAGPKAAKGYYLSAVNFFESEMYQICLGVIASAVPDFRPHDGLLPEGVDLNARKLRINRAALAGKQAQGDFFGSGVHDCERSVQNEALAGNLGGE